MSELLIYKASAGSGKTFTLAVEYIKHLILYSKAYRNILAVTFTNKATAEMKERVLSQLYGIWKGDAGSAAYLRRIAEDTRLTENEIRNSAGQALTNILHDYSSFRVETIDSFFQSVMRNLARELELGTSLNIELDKEGVLSEAVDSMIEKLRPDSPVLSWLLDYIYERIATDKRWNVSEEIKKFGNNIFNEEYIEKGTLLREHLKNPQTIPGYKKKLNILMNEALEEMKQTADRFDKVLEANGLTPDDLKGGATRGIGSYFRKLRKGELTDKTRNTTVLNCLDDEKNWAAKTSPRYGEILSLAALQLIPLLEDSEEKREKNNVAVNSCRLSLQHLNKLQLLANIDEEVRFLNKENNRFLLSDTNALLRRLVKDDDSSFVFEKIGAGIRHVMIDEFQDTSRMQWGNFRILLLEGLSQGANSLIVGDVKQSIYRWRNGDWGILNSLNDKIGNFPVTIRTLATNRRSETNVIRFNNALFNEAVHYLNSLHEAELGVGCEPLREAYRDVEQESPRTGCKGYIKIELTETDEEYGYEELTLKRLGEEVMKLLESGVDRNDIAILVRKNKNIPGIAEYFNNELNCAVVSDEAFRLDASLSVCMLINALRFLSTPSDNISSAQLSVCYQKEVLKRELTINDILLRHETPFLPEEYLRNRDALRLLPLYELLEKLYVIFQLDKIKGQDAYIFAFFDSVVEYLKDKSPCIDEFIDFWDTKLYKKTIPGDELEGIRILSIHKSKGLEFHTVLVPFCDWKLESETNNQLVWCTPQEAPYNEIDIVPVTFSSLMAESVYREDYLNERLQLWVDNLNLLYVAFTRAGKNLVVWGKKGKKGTVSEILTAALPGLSQRTGVEWEEDAPFEMGEICPSEAKEAGRQTNKLLEQPGRTTVAMTSLESPVKFRQSNRSASFIESAGDTEEPDAGERRDRFINKGHLLHTLFSAIATMDDIEPAIRQLLFEGIIGTKEQENEVRQITAKAFALPEARDWYSGEWKLFAEQTIIYHENNVLEIRRPDRVMMKEDRVVVVDFKFGSPREKHKKQVGEYMDLLGRMGYENVEGYIWYVENEALEPVRP